MKWTTGHFAEDFRCSKHIRWRHYYVCTQTRINNASSYPPTCNVPANFLTNPFKFSQPQHTVAHLDIGDRPGVHDDFNNNSVMNGKHRWFLDIYLPLDPNIDGRSRVNKCLYLRREMDQDWQKSKCLDANTYKIISVHLNRRAFRILQTSNFRIFIFRLFSGSRLIWGPISRNAAPQVSKFGWCLVHHALTGSKSEKYNYPPHFVSPNFNALPYRRLACIQILWYIYSLIKPVNDWEKNSASIFSARLWKRAKLVLVTKV